MYAPRFPKPQTEGFFVVAWNVDTKELVALKRVAWPAANANAGHGAQRQIAGRGGAGAGGKAQAQMHVRSTLRLPPHEQPMVVEVEVVSDGYVGMSWKVGRVEVPATPVQEEEEYQQVVGTIAVEEVGAPKKG